MEDLADHETQSPFLSLPAEIRLHIYKYVVPHPADNFCIDLCTPQRNQRSEFTFRKHSVISNLLNQVLTLETITRTNGLHLLIVSRRTRAEVYPLLSDLTVKFHCPRCFEELLRNLSFGLGVGVFWMKHIEISLNLHQSDQYLGGPLTIDLARTMAQEATQTARRTAWLYYGRLDLMGRETWKYEPLSRKRRRLRGDVTTPEQGENQNQNQNQVNGQDIPWQLQVAVHQATVAHADQIPGQAIRGPSISEWVISAWFDV